jgi:hypothetical protein
MSLLALALAWLLQMGVYLPGSDVYVHAGQHVSSAAPPSSPISDGGSILDPWGGTN